MITPPFEVSPDKWGEVTVGVTVISASRGYPPTRDDPGADDEIEYVVDYLRAQEETQSGDGVSITLEDEEAWKYLDRRGLVEPLDAAVEQHMESLGEK